MVRVFVPAVALMLALSGCAHDEPYGEHGPSSTASAPEARFDVEVTPGNTEVEVRYRFSNDGDEPLMLVNRPAVPSGGGVRHREDTAYVTEDAGGGALLSQALFGFPESDHIWESVPRVGVTMVKPGETVEVDVRSALPLTWFHPFGNDFGSGTLSVPSDVEEVRFCLGVVSSPFPESMTPRTEEDGTRTVGHASADQHLFCSDPEEL
ncbi:hypothetical protein J2S40_003456 [Nocardioides luteus]|uniref:Uncharacterized protein n=1 Tax=Nocardioides luteus TaxID=1844 RepID=A0ABQ5SX93_9ACTN|nr:hypothetical protein [Nocardioides luteus]MDR7312398.1 hypothetical protein [Nocardioides luteus]GGR58225.1 hypothetical protein GCM10010197_26230 [Nocardioides luteus]GLJ68645.1 hypothetical protein GCM10017579_26810 [Nocardioides luteus]